MNSAFLRTIGTFFVAGFAGGIAITIIEFRSEGFTLLTPLLYGISAGVGGLIWVLFRGILDLSRSIAFFLVACMASAIVTGFVLLQFGYSMTTYEPDAGPSEYLTVALTFGAGSLVYGLIHRYQTHNKSGEGTA